MSERTDLLDRLRELDSRAAVHRQAEASARRLVAAGDLAGATAVLDDLELALHPALAAGGGGGGPASPDFTEGVTITPTSNTDIPLVITMPDNAEDEGIDGIRFFADPVQVPNDGQPLVVVNDQGITILGPQGLFGLQMLESDGQGSANLDPGQGVSVAVSGATAAAMSLGWASGMTPDVLSGALLEAKGFGSSKVGDVKITSGGYLVIARNAVVPDDQLAPGDLGFSFDQTNGAAKLLLKGKTANGTVVTAQVAMS